MTTDEFRALRPGDMVTCTTSWGECMYLVVTAVDTDTYSFTVVRGIVVHVDGDPELVQQQYWIRECDTTTIIRMETLGSYVGAPE